MATLEINTENYKYIDVEKLNLPAEYTFPYEPEVFTEKEQEVLLRYFTNTDKPVFAIFGLEDEIVGALLSKYSRTDKSIRRVFLDQFYSDEKIATANIEEYLLEQGADLKEAKEESIKFYKRNFQDPKAEYGDDSIVQMGSCHVCFEYVSQIAAKAIEDNRIGVAYIEKSTRYVNFRDKEREHYLFMEVPEIMESEFKEEFLTWNNALFDAYSKHYSQARRVVMKNFPIEQQTFLDRNTGENLLYGDLSEEQKKKAESAWKTAIKAKTLDTIRVFLPTTTVTNLGAHLSGQAAEHTINKMLASDHAEVRLLGLLAYNELSKVINSFLSNVDYTHGEKTREYLSQVKKSDIRLSPRIREAFKTFENERPSKKDMEMVFFDEEADLKIASAVVYERGILPGRSLKEISNKLRDIKDQELVSNPNRYYSHQLAEIIKSSLPRRENRRHKLPRVFELAGAVFEAYADWGIFRDLQRNRMNTILRQALSAEDVFVPKEFFWPGMEEIKADYLRLAGLTRDFHRRLRASGDKKLVNSSEYLTIFGNKLRFVIAANLRQWGFIGELRTIEGGHPTYRILVQKIMKDLLRVYPYMKTLIPNINWIKDVGLGRLRAEFKTEIDN